MIAPDLSTVSAAGRLDLVSYRKNSPAVGGVSPSAEGTKIVQQ